MLWYILTALGGFTLGFGVGVGLMLIWLIVSFKGF